MPRYRSAGAAQRLAGALLVEALRTAGLLSDRKYRVTAAMRRTAGAWLLGALDDQVVVPVAWVCDALGIDASVLAAIVRARVAA
jgi:hypothetical protein